MGRGGKIGGWGVVFCAVLGATTPAQAAGNVSHMAVANHVLDELQARDFSTLPQVLVFERGGRRLEIPINVTVAYEAIVAHPDFFRGGAVGPNAFPDPFTGQIVYHGNESELLRTLTERVTRRAVLPIDRGTTEPFQDRQGPSEFRSIDLPMAMLAFANSGNYAFAGNERAEVLAFIMGYFAHSLSDAFLNAWANQTIGAAWDLQAGTGMFGDFTEEVQSIAISALVDARVPRDLTSTSGAAGAPLDRLTPRIPVNFLDAFYRRQTPNAIVIGNPAGDLTPFIQYYSNMDLFFGGPAYNYFNAQVDLAPALVRWSTLSDFFEFAEDARTSVWQQSLFGPAKLPQAIVDELQAALPGEDIAGFLAGTFGQCAIDLDPTWLTDVWEHIGRVLQRVERHSEKARVARVNWLRLSECTSQNLARLREGPFDPTDPTRNRDACAVLADRPWQDEGDALGLDRGTVRPEHVGGARFLNELKEAFRGRASMDPSLTLEETNEHRLASRNLRRMLDYLIGVALTADTVDEILLTGSDASDTILHNYEAICDSVRQPLIDQCVALAVAGPLVAFRVAQCTNVIAQCTTDFFQGCAQAACTALCDASIGVILDLVPGFGCSDVCSGLGNAPQTVCNTAADAICCEDILVGQVCIPGCTGLIRDNICDVLGSEAANCSAQAALSCGDAGVSCTEDIFTAAVLADRPSDAVLSEIRRFCDAGDLALDRLAAFKNPDTRADLLINEAGVDPADVDTATQMAGTVENIFGVLYDVLLQAPPETFVNLAFFQRDLQDPTYLATVLNAFGQVQNTINALPQGPDRTNRQNAFNAFNAFVQAAVAGGAAPPLTVANVSMIQTAHQLGVIPTFVGPTAANLLGQMGPDLPRSFPAFCSAVRGAQTVPLARADIDALFQQEQLDPARLPWNQPNLFSQQCGDNPLLLCDVGPSMYDPECIGCTPATNANPDATRFDWVPGRGVAASDGFDSSGRPLNVLTNFPFASSQEAYDRIYSSLFCLPGETWTMFRGQPARLGQAHTYGPRDAAAFRAFATAGDVVSSPVFGPDGTIYVGSDGGRVYALTPALTPLWPQPFQTGSDIVSSPAVSNGSVYIGAENGNLYRIDAGTGAEVWRFDAGGEVMSSPLIGPDGTIYFLSDGSLGRVRLHALGPDRTAKWPAVVVEGSQGLGDDLLSSPAIAADGRLFFGVPGGENLNFYAVNSSTGQILWHGGFGRSGGLGDAPDIRATPAVAADGTVYVGTLGQDAALFAIDAADGQPRWSFRLPCSGLQDCGVRSSAAISEDGLILFGSMSGEFFALDAGGQLLWRFATGGSIVSSPTVGTDGIVYFGSNDGFLYALRSAPGLSAQDRLVFRQPLQGDVRSSPAVSSTGVLYVGSDADQLFAVGPSIQSTLGGSGCANQPDGTSCDDGAACTTEDVCFTGLCTGTDSCPADQLCRAQVNSCQPLFRSLYATFSDDFGGLSVNTFDENGTVARFEFDAFASQGARLLGEARFFDGGQFAATEQVDALSVLPNGMLVLSTTSSASLSGLSFSPSDLVRYNPVTRAAAFHFRPGSLMQCVGVLCTLNVDAVHILDNGDILFSTQTASRVTATNQQFHAGSIIRFRVAAGTFSEEVDEARLDFRNVDGIGIDPVGGTFLVSFSSDGSFAGGPRFEEEDIIKLPYGPTQPFIAGYALYFDASVEMLDADSNLRDFEVR